MIKVGLIGCGFMGGMHAACYAALASLDVKVVAVADDNGIKVADEVNGASVSAKVLKNGKEKKVIVYKMKPKKGYRKKQGHRQPYTKVQIEKISM